MNAEFLKEARLSACLTLDALAERAGLSPNSVFRVEAGLRPSPETAKKLAKALRSALKSHSVRVARVMKQLTEGGLDSDK